MAQFRGLIEGQRGPATRLGSKGSGLQVEAQSWQGKVVVRLWHDAGRGVDMATVELAQHTNGAGAERTIYCGPVGGE